MLIIISPSIHPLLCILHPCTVSILCFIRCQFRRLSSVLAHSLSVVNEGLVPPLRIPCVGHQTASLDVVGYELLAVIFVRPGSFLWCWYRHGFAGLGGLCSQKSGQYVNACVFVRVRVNKRGVFCMPVEPCRGSSPALNRGIVISFCSYLPSHYLLQLLCWCISGVSGLGFRLILMSLLFSLSESPQPGWEERVHADGRTFYIDHSKDTHLLTKST